MNAIRNHICTQPASILRSTLALAVLALLAVAPPALAAGRNPNPGIPPVHSSAFGKTLAEWSAVWWKVGIETPVDGSPFVVGGIFPISASVSGLVAAIGSGEFEFTLPAGKALFVAGITFECSSLEPPDTGFHGDTEAEQAACAKFWTDHVQAISIEVDGKLVQDVASYRVVSPQFSFTAPDPNFLGVPGGGAGTAVADGYNVLLAPMSKGEHTILIRGHLHFSTAEGDPFDAELDVDNLFHITVE